VNQVTSAHYGKARIPVMRIARGAERDSLFQAVVAVDTEGERIVDAYTRGDNSAILATDTMKNLVYVLMLDYEVRSSEDLARYLGREFLRRYATITPPSRGRR
jgi:urate oxidase